MTINRNKASVLAWALFLVAAVMSIIGAIETIASQPENSSLIDLIGDLYWVSGGILFALLGALIVNQQPRNGIGWLMMLIGTLPFIDYLVISYLDHYPLPLAEPELVLFMVLIAENTLWLGLVFPLFMIMLLFPNGQPPSPRWRWIIYFALAMIAFFLVFGLLTPEFTRVGDSSWIVTNPIVVLPVDLEFPMGLWSAGLAGLAIFCAAAPFVRYRRSSGVEREQIKWLFFGCGLFALFYIPAVFLTEDASIFAYLINLILPLSIMAIPIAISIAILRYRLYDINVIIRKTLIYTALTIILGAIYFGSILLLQSLFDALTGQSSPLIIVISTLIIAALSAPLHRRLQDGIDRRFFRKKYNAQMILAQFAKTVRDEVELEALTAELARVTIETVQPQSVSVWLKDQTL